MLSSSGSRASAKSCLYLICAKLCLSVVSSVHNIVMVMGNADRFRRSYLSAMEDFSYGWNWKCRISRSSRNSMRVDEIEARVYWTWVDMQQNVRNSNEQNTRTWMEFFQFNLFQCERPYFIRPGRVPQDRRTTRLHPNRTSLVGVFGLAIRSSITARAMLPISRHG